MGIEIERKFLNVNLEELRRRLIDLGAAGRGAHFESNYVMDTREAALYSQKRLLRLRQQEWFDKKLCFMTFKKPLLSLNEQQKDRTFNNPDSMPPVSVARNKEREELETEIGDIGIALSIFENLGYQLWAKYEKIRESFVLKLPFNGSKTKNQKIGIDLDSLCFAEVVEIEAAGELIDMASELLGLDKYETSITNYHKLHQDWRRKNGLPPQRDFVFEGEERKRLRAGIGLKD